jgi:hypothetical protein
MTRNLALLEYLILDNRSTPSQPHNGCLELDNIFIRHFKLREVRPNNFFRLIATGDLGLWHYERGLNAIDVYSQLRPGTSGRTLTVLVGSVDDGFWRAETVQIMSTQKVDSCFKKLKVTIDALFELPTPKKLNELLSAATHPYIMTGEFE